MLLAELRAPCVWNHLEENRHYPSAESAANGNCPVFTSKTILADLKGEGSNLNDENLAASNANPHENEHPVSVNAAEYVNFVIDHTAVNEVEDLHDCEYVKDICHLARGSLVLSLKAPEWCSIPVADTTRIDEWLVTAVT